MGQISRITKLANVLLASVHEVGGVASYANWSPQLLPHRGGGNIAMCNVRQHVAEPTRLFSLFHLAHLFIYLVFAIFPFNAEHAKRWIVNAISALTVNQMLYIYLYLLFHFSTVLLFSLFVCSSLNWQKGKSFCFPSECVQNKLLFGQRWMQFGRAGRRERREREGERIVAAVLGGLLLHSCSV